MTNMYVRFYCAEKYNETLILLLRSFARNVIKNFLIKELQRNKIYFLIAISGFLTFSIKQILILVFMITLFV